jgi:1-acyl-sn-glycerol-3-phosphate acyltransferase
MSSIEFSSTLLRSSRDASPDVRCVSSRADGDLQCRVPGLIARLNYALGQLIGRSVFSVTMNVRVLRPEAAERHGGYVLACTHLSHVDPVCAGVLVRRKIDWMARIEFFRSKLGAAYLRTIDAFPVNRFGVPVKAVRTAIARARAGRIVGIFPEGGVAVGADSVCRGGPIKKGACLVAQRAGVPIIPCVILGTHRLNQPLPWIPYRRAHLWVAFGEPVQPRQGHDRKAARNEMAAELRGRFAALFREAMQTFGIPEGEIP